MLLAALIVGRYSELEDDEPGSEYPGTSVVGKYRVWDDALLTFEPWYPCKSLGSIISVTALLTVSYVLCS
jgi:hypothetical protein